MACDSHVINADAAHQKNCGFISSVVGVASNLNSQIESNKQKRNAKWTADIIQSAALCASVELEDDERRRY